MMRHQMRNILWGFCFLGAMAAFPGASYGEGKVALQLKYPMGRTARYRHTFSISFYSDRAELILLTGARTGSVRADVDGQWRSIETVSPIQAEPWEKIEEGTTGIKLKIEKADSRAMFMNERLTYEQFPFTMDMLNEREFWLHLSPAGVPVRLEPAFQSYTLPRQDMITELRQVWQPDFIPALPAEPVGEGDTWTGEMEFEWPFAKPELGQQHKARVKLSSTYKVKKVETKKGITVLSIEEARKVDYKAWVHVELVSLLVEGQGLGAGKWEIDATRGLVLSHDVTMDVDRPLVMIAGDRKPLDDIRAEFKVAFQRKLDKLEKE